MSDHNNACTPRLLYSESTSSLQPAADRLGLGRSGEQTGVLVSCREPLNTPVLLPPGTAGYQSCRQRHEFHILSDLSVILLYEFLAKRVVSVIQFYLHPAPIDATGVITLLAGNSELPWAEEGKESMQPKAVSCCNLNCVALSRIPFVIRSTNAVTGSLWSWVLGFFLLAPLKASSSWGWRIVMHWWLNRVGKQTSVGTCFLHM